MSAQIRLEALKLAIAAGGRLPLAVDFEKYLKEGVLPTTTTLALNSKKSDDATPVPQRVKRGLDDE